MIAEIASSWAGIEDSLGLLLADMLTADRVAATRMFYALGSLSARLDALRAAAKVKLAEHHYKHLSETLIPEIRRRSRERADIVHAQWGDSSHYPDGIVRVLPFWHEHYQPFVLYKRQDFQKTLDRIEQLRCDLLSFMDSVERREPPEEFY